MNYWFELTHLGPLQGELHVTDYLIFYKLVHLSTYTRVELHQNCVNFFLQIWELVSQPVPADQAKEPVA